MILTITLNPALDLFCQKVSGPLKDAFIKDLYWHAGGKGVNVTRALKRIGHRSIALGCVGGMAGERIRQLLKREGIGFEFVPCRHETRTNVTFLSATHREVSRVMGKGHPLSSAEISSVKKLCRRYGRSASIIALSGSLPPGVRQSLYGELIREIQKENISCLLDSHGEAFRKGLKARPCYIKPNRAEAEVFLNQKLNSKISLIKAVRRFHDLGIEHVMISLGKQGAVGSDGGAVWQAIPPAVKVRHTVGCGDSFVAGFLSAVEDKFLFYEALRRAVAMGTAAALGKGPGDVDPKAFQRILKQVKLQRLV